MDRPFNKYYYRESTKNKKKIIHKKRQSIFFYLFLMLFVLLCFVALVKSPVFKLERIDLIGNERVNAEQIIRAANVEKGATLWQVNNRMIRNQLEGMPLIQSAEVSYLMPKGISIIVEEKEPVALAPYQGKFLEISRDGTVLGAFDKIKGDKPLLTGINFNRPFIGQNIKDEDIYYLEEILHIFCLFSSETLSMFSDFNVNNSNNLIVYTLDGTEIWLGSENFDKKIREIPNVLVEIRKKDTEPNYIDLRVNHFPQNNQE